VSDRPYTETFIRTSDHTGWATYQVPPGRRAVIKHVTLVNPNEAAVIGTVLVGGLPGAQFICPARTTQVVTTTQVAYQGENVSAIMNLTGCGLTVAGYLFLDSTGADGPGREARAPRPEMKPVK
jgi:hypothetical protein